MNRDFEFTAVNPQFCDILGVTPAELLGKRFTDVTPISVRELDARNANLVIQGKIPSYLLPKSYEFSDGTKTEVVLLVVGVYSETKDFLFFVSRIMEQKQPMRTPPSKWLSGVLSGLKELAKKQWIQVVAYLAAWLTGLMAVYFAGK